MGRKELHVTDANGISAVAFVRLEKRKNAERVAAMNCMNQRGSNDVSWNYRFGLRRAGTHSCICTVQDFE